MTSPPALTIGPVLGSFFANANNSGTFDVSPVFLPLFTEQFQTIDFNPPSSAQSCNPTTSINEFSRPFADVIPLNNGSCAVQIAASSTAQAGVDLSGQGGPNLTAFEAVFTATLRVAQAGQQTFNLYSDDGWVLAIGPNLVSGAQPTYVSGSLTNPPASGPFTGYRVVGAYNQPSSPTLNTVTVNFPAAGSYPIEADYTECCGGQLAFTLGSSASTPIPPQSITGPPTPEQHGGSDPSSTHNTTCNDGQYPVNCATGEFWHTFSDLAVPGRGLPLHVTRTYGSLSAGQDGPLGFGWTDNYNMALTTDASGVITVTQENGSAVAFTPLGGGAYQGPSRVPATLVTNGDGTLTFSRADQTQYVFTAPSVGSPGPLLKEVDRNGYATTLAYSNGHLSTVTDPAGRALTFSYNAAGRLASISDPISRTVVFTYDAAGNLTAAQDVAGGVTQFSYDPSGSHLLLSMTDPRGGTVSNQYDANGRVLSQTDPLSRTTTYAYSTNSDGSQTTTITDARGLGTTELYQNNELVTLTKGAGTPQQATWTYSYDPVSLGIASETDPNGHTSTNTWDANGNLLSHTDALGRTTSYHYDSLNDTTAITDPLSVTTVMTYDAQGNLLQVARPLTQTGQTALTTLSYDPAHPGDVLTRTDPNGHSWHYSYDPYGDLASATDPLSHTTTYSYDAIGRRVSMVRPLGNVSGANPISYTTSYTYNAFGQTTAMTDGLGHVTTYQYDPDQNLLAVTDALSRTTRYGYDLDNERTSATRADGGAFSTGYDGDGNVVTATDALSHTMTYSYDPLNRRVSTTDPLSRTTLLGYDLAGNLISTTDPLSHTTLYGYDAANQRVSVTHPDGGVLRLGYDLDGRVITSTDALARTTSYGYDSLGRLLSVTDPLTRTTTYSYDLAGNRTNVTDPLSHTTSYGYDAANELTSVTRADGSVLRTAYDADGNVISSTDPLSHTTLSSYDVLDRLLTVTDPLSHTTSYGYDAVGNQLSMTDPLSHTMLYSYDALNRVITATDPLSHTTGYGYDLDGNQTSVTDGRNHTTSTGYDAANEPITTTLANGKVQRTAYDADGNVLSQSDALTRTTLYGYDLDNRLTSVTDPLSRTTRYRYDLADEAISRTDALSQTTLYGYDGASELTGITYALTSTPNVTFTYTLAGQRATMTDGTGTTSYQYDALNRPITVTNGANQSVGYGYDLAGNLTTLRYPDTSIITRTYDAANRLTSVSDWLGHTTQFAYDAADNLITQTYPNTTTVVFTYNKANQLTKLVDNVGSSPLWTYSYTRGALGELLGATDPLDGKTHTYSYNTVQQLTTDQQNTGGITTTATWSADSTFELTQAVNPTGPYTSTYSYDHAHELTGLATVNAATTTQNLSLGYNADGDRTSQSDSVSHATASYGYDQENRLITATVGVTNASYAYNGNGLRMSKTVSGTTEAYVWDAAEGLPTILQDGSTRYVTGPDGVPIEQIDGTGTVLFYYADQLGSTRGLLNSSGQVVASYWYDAYGTRHVVTGTASTTPFGYAGQYTDAETGLQYLRARYYDPATQQFLSPDPLAAITGLPYAYTPADPLNGTDASGLTTGQICVSIQGGFGLGGFIQICPLAQSTDPTGTHSDEYGFTISVGGGKYTPSASVGGGITVTNADTLEQLNGGGVYAGGSVGEGWGIGGDVSYNLSTCHPVVGVGVSVSLGVRDAVPPIPIPAEIHAGYSNTWAIQYKDVPGLILSTIVRLL